MKKIFWIVAGLLLLIGLISFSILNIGPRSIRKVKLMPLESPQVLANVIGLRLQEEIRQAPVTFIGVFPADTFAVSALRLFLQSPPPNIPAYDEVWVDEEFQTLFPGRPVFLRNNVAALSSELEESVRKGRRVAVLTSPIYASTFLSGSPAAQVAEAWSSKSGLDFVSLLFTDFPRRREDENQQRIPCVLDHSDQTGTGPLGCQILQMARSSYRKQFPGAGVVGLMNQINRRDYLFVTAPELEPLSGH